MDRNLRVIAESGLGQQGAELGLVSDQYDRIENIQRIESKRGRSNHLRWSQIRAHRIDGDA